MKIACIFSLTNLLFASAPAIGLGSTPTWIIDTDFLHSIRLGNMEAVQEHLNDGMDVNTVGHLGWTPLMHALDARQTEVAKILIHAGAKVQVADERGRCAMWLACQCRDPTLVRLMLDKGAKPDPRLPTNDYDTFFLNQRRGDFQINDAYPPLEAAIRFGPIEVIEELVAFGLDLREPTFDILLWAAKHSNPETIQYLARKGWNPNGRSQFSTTPLIAASALGNIENVKILLQLGADPNKIGASLDGVRFPHYTGPPHPNATPLLAAVVDYQADVAKILIEAGADASTQDNLPIKIADLFGDQTMYDLLLSAGAKAPGPYPLGKITPFHLKELKERSLAQTQVGNVDALGTFAERVRQMSAAGTANSIPDGQNITCAIIAEEDLEAHELTLTATLSDQPGLSLVERSRLDTILKEQQLAESLGSITGNLKAGQLLGAEALVIIKRARSGTKHYLVSHIVNARTGIILDSHYLQEDTKLVEQWSAELESLILAAAPKILAPPDDAVFISIPHLFSAGTTDSERAIARQFNLILRSHLIQSPNVYLLEREDLKAFVLEKNLANGDSSFKGSSWLLEGSLEQSDDMSPKGLSLNLRLLTVDEKEKRDYKLSGSKSDLIALSQKCTDKILDSLAREGRRDADLSQEAQVYARQAAWFFQNGFFPQAISASDTAWALGLNDPSNDRIGIMSRGRIIENSFVQQKRTNGVDFNFMEWKWRAQPAFYNAQLVATSEGRDLNDLSIPYQDLALSPSPRQYFDLAFSMVDDHQRTVSALKDKNPEKQWNQLGYTMRQASMPLALFSSLSTRNELATERTALQQQLIELNDKLIESAKADNDITLLEHMLVLRCLLAELWFDQSGQFSEELLRIFRQESKSPTSEEVIAHAIFTAAENGYPNDRFPSPCPNRKEWSHIVEILSGSSKTNEQFLGISIHANSRNQLADMETYCLEAIALFPRVYISTTGQRAPGALWLIADDYFSIITDVINKASNKGAGGVFREFIWFPRSESGPLLSNQGRTFIVPERTQFLADLALMRIEKIAHNLNGGTDDTLWRSSMGLYGLSKISNFSSNQINKLSISLEKCEQALTRLPNRSPDQQKLLENIQRFQQRVTGRLEKSEDSDLENKILTLEINHFKIPLIDGEFRGGNLHRETEPSGCGSTAYPVYFGGSIWWTQRFHAKKYEHSIPQFVMQYDIQSDKITLIPMRQRTNDPLCISDEHVFSMGVGGVINTYDRRKENWQERKLADNIEVKSFTVSGNYVTVLFEESGKQTKSEKNKGVLLHDIHSGKNVVLVNTARKPAQSPLDYPTMLPNLFRAQRDDKNRVYFGRGSEKQPMAYHLADKKWVPITKEETSTFTTRGYQEGISLDGNLYRMNYKTWENREIRVYHPSKSVKPASISVNFDFALDESKLKNYPVAYEQYDFLRNSDELLRVYNLPVGIFIAHDPGFFFVSKERMTDVLRNAFPDD